MNDHGKFTESAFVDKLNWHVRTVVEKFREDLSTPYEVLEGEGNLLLNAGIDELWQLFTDAGGTPFNGTNTRIGVGNTNTAAVATQADLLGTPSPTAKFYQIVDGTYPQFGSQSVIFKVTFGTTDANFAWEEWVVDNKAVAGTKCLNRKVQSFGTKASGETWSLTVTITLS